MNDSGHSTAFPHPSIALTYICRHDAYSPDPIPRDAGA
jgi:hypothetical protein